ncbi:hypothetical protein M9979_10035 [Sphingomonas sp. RP10(2022)]|uniref:Uncharacterized protein n=1 Tax=Sphingomonas liriopis TaxID=2949094 RepID=A0A9X2KTS7_9SPHN|nr:hypothetical protein [Sphingomonas liriopis]MCP3735208.1 hypothetical protein [Sphingomonas liriopis]
MSKLESHVFSFEEADHLTRIHLKLALEDVGFAVEEDAVTLGIVTEGAVVLSGDGGAMSSFLLEAGPSPDLPAATEPFHPGEGGRFAKI